MKSLPCKYAPFQTNTFTFSTKLGLFGLLFIAFSWFPISSQAQSANDKKEEAKLFFANKRYETALSLLQSTRALYRDDKESKFLIALCYYQLNQLDKALAQLNRFSEEERSPYPELWLYYGRIYHARHQFDQASTYYKRYLRTIRPGHNNRQMVIEDIRRCSNGISLQFQEALAIVENLGKSVNTANDEFAPILSPNYNNQLYFSSIRPGNIGVPRKDNGVADERFGNLPSDMYNCRITGGIWGEVQPMHYLLNGPNHEVLLGFNRDGSALYYYKGRNLQNGQIIVDTFKRVEERLVSSTPIPVPMDTYRGDNNPCFYNDTLLIFSSSRAGGYGGSDLYKCSYRRGRWTAPVNLGPDINTPYDETTPFLARDGHTLYYSSNDSKRSIGGLDIFKSFYVEETKRWTLPKNLGMPINSAADDDHFKISGDGFTAFFASARKDGEGLRDIYIGYFQEFLEEMEWPANAFIPPPPTPQPQVPEKRPIVDDPGFQPTSPAIAVPDPSTKVEDSGFGEDFPVNEVVKQPTSPNPSPITVEPTSPYAPIYFTQGEEFTRHTTKREVLDQIAQQMGTQPSLVVVFTVYPDEVTPDGLFGLTKELEIAGDYLSRQGVNSQNIYIRAIGMPKAERSGQCLEISFFDREGQTIPATLPVVGKQLEAVEPTFVTNSQLHYKVQVASAKKSISAPFEQGVDYVMIERQMDFPYYRYTLGVATSYSEASSLRRQLVRKGFNGAYVVPFINGYRLDKKLARKKMGEFQDLRNFLQLR
ncbi:MAG: tetratricopeptide repeat protein [Saprospiraceae bacterium]|nr:tetratricopeptide repeat protein [Saprospiraceae bacterium]